MTAFVSVAVTLGGVLTYGVPVSNAGRGSIEEVPGIADSVTIRPWGDDLSKDAVSSGGIENDLDGNASALKPSDTL